MDDEHSVLDAVDAGLRGFSVAATLEQLFTRPATSTPSRTVSVLDWQTFGLLVCALVAYTLDSECSHVAVSWDDPLFAEVRASLADGAAVSPVNYDKSVPLLKIYKEYAGLVSELRVPNHPLALALGAGKSNYTPQEQAQIKQSFELAFTAALKFRQLHQDFLSDLKTEFTLYDQAEIRYREVLDDVGPDVLSPASGRSFDPASFATEKRPLAELEEDVRALEEHKNARQQAKKALASELSGLQGVSKTLEQRLNPVRVRIEDMKDHLSRVSRELDRRETRAHVSEEDVERARQELAVIADTDQQQQEEITQLEDAQRHLTSEIQRYTSATESGLVPLKAFIENKVCKSVSAHRKAVHDAGLADADLNTVQVMSVTQSQIWRQREEEAEAEVDALRKEVEELKAQISRGRSEIAILTSSEHREEQRRREELCQALRSSAAEERRAERESLKRFETQMAAAEALYAAFRELLHSIKTTSQEYARENAGALHEAIQAMTTTLIELT